jgi:integrase
MILTATRTSEVIGAQWEEIDRDARCWTRLGDRMSVLPVHGKGKELGTGLVKAIKKQLGLE